MLKRVRPDETATIYVGLVEYELNQGGSVTGSTSYYAVPGARVVRSAAGVFWVLTDHLGSSSVTVDASGDSVVGTVRYEAFGGTRVSTGNAQTDKLYTGQRAEATGLYFYNARWYDPYLNRWIQPDTIVPEPGNPQSLNRFSYSLSNPIRYIDPDGHDPIDALAYLTGIVYGWGHANLMALSPILPQPAIQQYEALAVDSTAFQAGRALGGVVAIVQGVVE